MRSTSRCARLAFGTARLRSRCTPPAREYRDLHVCDGYPFFVYADSSALLVQSLRCEALTHTTLLHGVPPSPACPAFGDLVERLMLEHTVELTDRDVDAPSKEELWQIFGPLVLR